ncbi:hypothetical protein K431DRAFT_282981 [Polychaeton citri CBS 116435]|uniref:DUF1254 domain-containing protein n=1 Tax=Polychaeton citri CBS 116435 TaxID=1314669 RepID=A0A9P4UR47_9PEZI|nr:hypothetical protein K431DRAFT_282981 [Polychaeton citri CBS 116435]
MRTLIILSILHYALGLTHTSQQDATIFSLLYGYPLLAWEQLAAPLVYSSLGVNQLHHGRELQTASSDLVVKPNADTLYSVMIYDLSHNDVIITMPNISDSQFALFGYFDLYGNNFVNIGPNNSENAGSYRLVRRPNNTALSGFHVGDSDSSAVQGTIYSPATYGSLFIRWLVNATNLESIYAYQNATEIRNATKLTPTTNLPYLSSLLPINNSSTVAEKALDLLAKFAAVDGPETVSDTQSVNGNLTLAGVSDGIYTPVKNASIAQANQTALLQAEDAFENAQTELGNGWSMVNLDDTGDFGTKYSLRTAVASSLYIMVKAPYAIYPEWTNGSSSGATSGSDSIVIGANESYIYTFSAKPPIRSLGFWSVTAYHKDYLVPNDLGVYTLGDRSNITYPNGQLVYGTNASVSSGEFQILIQPADLPPPANWTNNWLPAPSGGGSMSAALRFYGGEDDLLTGAYIYPKVTKQAAIIGSRTASNGTASIPYTNSAGMVTTWNYMLLISFLSLLTLCSIL